MQKKIHIWSHFSEHLSVTRMNTKYRKSHLSGFFEQLSAINKVKKCEKLIPNKNPLPNSFQIGKSISEVKAEAGWKRQNYKQTQQKIDDQLLYLSQKLCEITRLVFCVQGVQDGCIWKWGWAVTTKSRRTATDCSQIRQRSRKWSSNWWLGGSNDRNFPYPRQIWIHTVRFFFMFFLG